MSVKGGWISAVSVREAGQVGLRLDLLEFYKRKYMSDILSWWLEENCLNWKKGYLGNPYLAEQLSVMDIILC